MAAKESEDKQSKPKELTCFIIMPFSEISFRTAGNENKTLSEEQLTHIYEQLFKRAVESYNRNDVRFMANRYTSQRGNFVKGIISDLDTADLVIADLTGLNHNVFYELGVRHTLRCGTLMITQNKKELASDLSNYIAIEYKYPEVSHEFNRYYPSFEKQLHAAIDEVLENPNRPDNPVRDFIGDRNIFRNEQRIKEVKGNIEIMGLLLKEFVSNTAHIGKQMENWSEGKSKTLYKLENTSGPFLNRLILLNEKETVISFVKEIVRDIQAIEYNMEGVMNSIIKEKDLKACPEIFFGFQDSSGKIHSILDLYDHYKKFREDIDINTLEPCPVVLSFQKFIKDWNDELEKLSK